MYHLIIPTMGVVISFPLMGKPLPDMPSESMLHITYGWVISILFEDKYIFKRKIIKKIMDALQIIDKEAVLCFKMKQRRLQS